jgi:DNA-binding NarL/FixJ family response regulator
MKTALFCSAKQAQEILVARGASPAAARLGPAAAASPESPAGLSPRELEVLRLVAEGKTNRDIAATLTISEKTAINHLSHIFNKIGCDNRAAATPFAFRHGLIGSGPSS